MTSRSEWGGGHPFCDKTWQEGGGDGVDTNDMSHYDVDKNVKVATLMFLCLVI